MYGAKNASRMLIGFSTTFTIEYWQGAGAPPAAGASITMAVYYQMSGSDAVRAAGLGLVDSVRNRYLRERAGIGPTPLAILGSASFIVGS